MKQISNQSEALCGSGLCMSTVQNFHARFSDVISWGNHRWHSEKLAVLQGYNSFHSLKIAELVLSASHSTSCKVDQHGAGTCLNNLKPWINNMKYSFIVPHIFLPLDFTNVILRLWMRITFFKIKVNLLSSTFTSRTIVQKLGVLCCVI